MIVLDTDHVGVLQYPATSRSAALVARLNQANDKDIVVTVISFEEQVRGWLAEIKRQPSALGQVRPYAKLGGLIVFFRDWKVIDFEAEAANRFDDLRRQRVRVATMDLKIASIALAHDALLLSANLRDFGNVPSLRVENWMD